MSNEIDPVEEASEESFPASDAPAWTMGDEGRRAPVVHNNEVLRRFEADGAFLEYRLSAGTITLVHTEVPPQLRGRGVAGELAKAALEFGRREGLQIVVRCPFVREYLRRHPEYASLDIITA